MAWCCYGTFSFAAILSDAFLQPRSSPCTDVHRAIQSVEKRREGRRKKRRTYCGRERREEKENIFTDVRTHSRVTSTLPFCGAQTRAISALSRWHLHCTFPCVATNASYKTYFFYVQERNCTPPEINARRTTVVKDPLCCALPLLAGNIIKED